MPENPSREERITSTPPKAPVGGSFKHRKEDILKRLRQSTEECRAKYSGRKELAAESDDAVAELCQALEDVFSYGLRMQETTALSPASFFQNMQEIVTGNIGVSSNDTTFWDFCQLHLTPHERERYIDLKNIWTKCGRGRAFIRAALNENSLQKYLLTWLNTEEELQRFYSPWSLLIDPETSQELPVIVGNLNDILFALTVDSLDLNTVSRSIPVPVQKEEPIIFAPSPVPVVAARHKGKLNPVERPIATASSTEDLLTKLQDVSLIESQQTPKIVKSIEELVLTNDENTNFLPTDPIEPELEFLKEPLPDFYPESIETSALSKDSIVLDGDDKSETSSQSSKSSSAVSAAHINANNNAALEEKLQEMSERCALLETRVAQLLLENRQLVRRLTRHFNESGIDPSSSLTANFLITIPQVKLLKSKRGGGSFYTYEIHITMRQNLEHWLLHRRYREFYKLHKTLLKTHPSVASVEFPPKKHFGNMNLTFVEERRQQLQIYLLNLVETLPQVEACKSKAELQKVFPFFRER